MKARHLVVASTLLGACQSTSAPTPSAPTVAGSPVVYGADGRTDWFAIASAPLKAQARATVAAMVPWDAVSSPAEDGTVTIFGEPTLGDSYGLCADQAFREQPTAAMCSGTLIGEDLLLTAGHCVPDLEGCASSAWVFDYLYEADGQLATITKDAVFRCVDVIVQPEVDLDPDLDMAVIQLDRVVGRAPARVAPDATVASGTPLVLAGFPNGIPLKVDEGGTIAAPRTQQGDYFVASVDAFSGNSGSGVLDDGLSVLGVLVSGANDYENAGSCAVVARLNPRDAEEAVMYAHHAATAACERGYPSAFLCPENPAGACGDGFCTGSELADGCTADCGGLFAVPEGWSCDASWYAASDDCDCNCGAWDPDCDNHALDVLNCGPGSACNEDGTCTVPIPEAWVCGAQAYGEGNRCNCDCGAPDPDCENARLDVRGCAPGGTCQADGTCTVSLPDGWQCRSRFYGTGDGCDCNCGARDPDCDDPDQEVFGCVPGSACNADGSCETPIPSGWVCDASTFGAGDACDCNCGLPDPDCATETNVRNCDGNEVCDADGRCAARTTDPEPEPEAVEAGPEAVEEVADEAPEVAEPEPDTVEPDADEDTADEVGEDTSDDVGVEPEDAAEVGEPSKGGKRDDGGCASGGGEASALAAAAGLWLTRRGVAGARARAR